MILLGLLLILAAAAVTVGAVYDGGDPATVEILGRELDTTVAGVFFTGMATMLVLIGAWLFRASMGRARRKRAERKETRNRHRDSVSRLEEERTNLRAENEKLNQELSSLAKQHVARTGGTASAGGGTATQERVATDRGTRAPAHRRAPRVARHPTR